MKCVCFLLLVTLGILFVVDAAACEPPEIRVGLTCDANAVLEIRVAATDPGDDLIELYGSILEYPTLEACRTGEAHQASHIWRDLVVDVFTPRHFAVVSERLVCVESLWYMAVGRAIDSHGDDAIQSTECCPCDRTIAPIEAVTWARIKAQYR